MARKIWIAATAAISAPSLRIPHHRQKLILSQHRNAKRLRFLQFRSGCFSGDDVRRLRRHRAPRLATFALNETLDVLAREARQRARDDDRLSGERSACRRGDETRPN